MTLRIEDYALIGDTQTAALVGRDGSIDWLCAPRFDSGACFAALLGDARHGRWLLAPAGGVREVRRQYREGTLVLETEFTTEDGAVRITDAMPIRGKRPDVVRVVEGLRGRVPMRMELVVRFDYGAVVPWVRTIEGRQIAIAGPDAVAFSAGVTTHGEDLKTVADFSVPEGGRTAFTLTWFPSNAPPPPQPDASAALEETTRWWRRWSKRCTYRGPWRDAVVRSLITLKALTYEPTGGIVAAATTSLPEWIGGVRNWDYRYCWVRDATFTLYALLLGGYKDEAVAWRDWMLRAAAGLPSELQIMYGPAGERRLTEEELDWLPGYEGSSPVRIGNDAHRQFQLDVYGEIMDALHGARKSGIEPEPEAWNLETKLMDFLESHWQEPDDGIWEVRGGNRDFTHSKMMAWVAFDRAVKAVEGYGLDGPVDRWRTLRDEIHRDVCEHGYDAKRKTFTQYYGSRELDASVLMMPLVGFLPADDERVAGTVAAIERELLVDGFVHRYTAGKVDGLPAEQGAFLACTFWLADTYALSGRTDEARATFERLLGLANDVGLLSEEYDPKAKRLLGNFPQALSHLSLVNTACNLRTPEKGHHRAEREP